MMPVGRDCLFVRKSTMFSKQEHFYTYKIQSNKALAVSSLRQQKYWVSPLLRSRYPRHMVNQGLASNKTAGLEVWSYQKLQSIFIDLPINAKELLLILWTGRTKFPKVAKAEISSILFVLETNLPVTLPVTFAQCTCVSSRQEVCLKIHITKHMLDDHKGGIGAMAAVLRLCQLFQVKLFLHRWQTGNTQISDVICHI